MEKTKRCCNPMCDKVLPLSQFGRRNGTADGLRYDCKKCNCNRAKEYSRTKWGLIGKIYRSQIRSSKHRGHPLPTYSNKELFDWVFSQRCSHEIFDTWRASGYDMELILSCDRLNDNESYTLSNLRVVTWAENRQKAYSDRKNGISNIVSKAVIGTHRVTGDKVVFHSQAEASRKTTALQSCISDCCLGIHGYAGDYYWEFNEGGTDG